MKLKLPNGATGFHREDGTWQCTGSQMGRRSHNGTKGVHCKLRLQRLPFIDGCYDRWGAYWGSPANVWRAWGFPDAELSEVEPEEIEIYLRADSRDEAKTKVREIQPNARFYK